ncbi:MAG: sigma-54 dependent transcriptional regulator [Steroidobacteraceae bacterium]
MNDHAVERHGASDARSAAWNGSLRHHEPSLGALIGKSTAMRSLYDQIERVAPTRASVLILGESGTGKGMVAQALHDLSPRAERPFVAVNCGGIPESLIEAELFGYERGTFTGAVRAHAGYFERAGDGTLLLDEITEMPLEMQAKLLRVLESGRLLRVGGGKDVELRCYVLAATSRDPQTAVAEGRLRADLLRRLAVFPLRVPSLRERGTDAALLARSFLRRLNDEEGTDKQLSSDSIGFTTEYAWPGNVGELRNAVQRAFILADDELDLRAALVPVTADGCESGGAGTPDRDRIRVTVGMTLAQVERAMVIATLKRCGGNKTRTAAMLGVSLKTLYNRLNEYRAANIAMQATRKPFTSASFTESVGS